MTSALTTPPALPGPVLPAARMAPPKRHFASFRTIMALILREMATSFGRSPGGYLWAVLEPIAGIALLSFVFMVAFRHPALGTSFPLFYATGMIPFTLYNDVSVKLAQAINYSRPLMAYPSVTFIDALLARFILNYLTEVMVAYIVFTGILMFFDTRVIINIPVIAEALLLSGALALGVGTLNCFLFTLFPIWQRGWSIMMRPMVIISCVMMLPESLPGYMRDWLLYNPLVDLVGLMRRGFYTSYHADYVSELYVLGFSGVCLVMGLLLLRRYQYVLLNI